MLRRVPSLVFVTKITPVAGGGAGSVCRRCRKLEAPITDCGEVLAATESKSAKELTAVASLANSCSWSVLLLSRSYCLSACV